jgi:hypothetical protein
VINWILFIIGVILFPLFVVLQTRNKYNPGKYLLYGFLIPLVSVGLIMSVSDLLSVVIWAMCGLCFVYVFQKVDVPFVRRLIAENKEKEGK